MVFVAHFSDHQNCNKEGTLAHFSNLPNFNKIPEYASQFRNEWLFIRGIDKECKRFGDRVNEHRLLKYTEVPDYDELEIFSSSQSKKLVYFFNKLLKCIKRGKLQDISNFELKEDDVNFIELLEIDLDDFMDSFCDTHSGVVNKERYENDDSGFREFYESYVKFKDKIKVEEIKNYYSDSDSDSDILKIIGSSDGDSDGIDSEDSD